MAPTPFRILLVEDNKGDAGLILRNLRDNGLAVASARVDTAGALRAILVKQAWDILLCDYSVPDLDLTRVMNLKDLHAPGTPVVLVTGAVGEEAVADLMRIGVADVVLKDRLASRLGGIVVREVGLARRRRVLEARQQRIATVLDFFSEATHWRNALESSIGYLAEIFAAEVAVVTELSTEPLASLSVTSWATDRFSTCGELLKSHPPIMGQTAIGSLLRQGRTVVIPQLRDRRSDGTYLLEEIVASGLTALISQPILANGRQFVLSLLFATGDVPFEEIGAELREISVAFQPVLFRKISEDELTLLWNALEVAHNGVIITEATPIEPPGPRIVYVNDAACRITGYDRSELLGQTSRLFQGPGTSPRALARVRRALAKGRTISAELLNYRRDGAPILVEMSISPLHDQDRVTHFISIQTDITERRKAELERRQHETSFRLLFENNPMPRWVYDIETLQFFQVNDAAVARYGWSRGEFLARTVGDVLPLEHLDAARAMIRELHQADTTVSSTHVTATGERIAARVAVRGLTYKGRAANLAVIWDVTDIERSRDELREINRTLAAMTDSLAARATALADAAELARIGYWRLDFHPRNLQWSPETFGILGLDPAVFSPDSRNVLAYVHPEDRASLQRLHRSLKHDGIVAQCEYRIVRPSGEVRVLRELPRLRLDAEGRKVGITGVVQDITDDLRVRRESHRWADAVKHAGIGITIVDSASDKVHYANPAFAAQHGMVPAEVLRHKVLDTYAPGDHRRVKAMLSDTAAAGHVVFEADRVRADGSVFPAMMTVTHVRPLDGSPPYRIKTILDITERRAAQAHALQMQRLATLGQLAAGLAHELNQPLAVIGVAAENAIALTEQGADPQAVLTKLRQVLAQSERAGEIVRNVVRFGRRDAGPAVPTSIADAIDGALAIVDARLRAGGITVRRKLSPGLPPAVMAQVKLEQVLTNLLVNAADAYALRYVAKPVIWIEARSDDVEILLTVSDAAGGMPEGELARIFEPFFTTKGPGEGTGLGLSISFDLVAGAGGSLRARNHNGGSAFEIRLPVGPVPESPIVQLPADGMAD